MSVHLVTKFIYEFDDQLGHEVYLGRHLEGGITRYGPGHDLVNDGTLEAGWHICIYESDESQGPFETFEEALRQFEATLNAEVNK